MDSWNWFLSTPPSRVATAGCRSGLWLRPVSIHATLAGGDLGPFLLRCFFQRFLSTPPSRVATRPGSRGTRRWDCFYPRHPRGWRHCGLPQYGRTGRVSIHATLAGGDSARVVTSFWFILFLSTPPSRVATPGGSSHHGPPGSVSIHATLAGGDAICSARSTASSRFLSTPPSRVATISGTARGTKTFVSIHATLAGGDSGSGFHFDGEVYVSIHATLAGGDELMTSGSASISTGFYPRHPRGWRRRRRGISPHCPGFYPRHPRGWRLL